MFPWVVKAALITQNPANFQQKLVDEPGVALLHSYPLKAYEFFPLWDRAIARAYGLPLQQRGRNAERYYRFMEVAQEQWAQLGGTRGVGRNPLKALDEYNYCRYTKLWIAAPDPSQPT